MALSTGPHREGALLCAPAHAEVGVRVDGGTEENQRVIEEMAVECRHMMGRVFCSGSMSILEGHTGAGEEDERNRKQMGGGA